MLQEKIVRTYTVKSFEMRSDEELSLTGGRVVAVLNSSLGIDGVQRMKVLLEREELKEVVT
jgi:hypothetical protein